MLLERLPIEVLGVVPSELHLDCVRSFKCVLLCVEGVAIDSLRAVRHGVLLGCGLPPEVIGLRLVHFQLDASEWVVTDALLVDRLLALSQLHEMLLIK